MKRNRETGPTPQPRAGGEWLPWVLFTLLLGGGLGFYVYHQESRLAHDRQQVADRQRQNEQLGLPRDYPSDVAPLYDGVTLDTATRGESKSSDGRPMDQWKVHAESDVSKDVIFPFYNKLMLDRGFQQTMYASVPNGYAVTFANDTSEIAFTIEKKRNDKRTQLDITFSRIQPGAPPPKPAPPEAAPAQAPTTAKPGATGSANPAMPATPPAPPAAPANPPSGGGTGK